MYLKTKAMKMMYYLLGWDLSCWVPWALWSAEAARVHGGENWGLVEAGRQGFFPPSSENGRGEGSWMCQCKHKQRQGSSWIMPTMSATTKFANAFLQLVLMADL